jgi:mono/diheme cytochrome c family protein
MPAVRPLLPWLLLFPLLAPAATFAQVGADDEDPFLPGLVGRLQDEKGHSATRLEPRLAFQWGELPPDPRLDAGEFRAGWQGSLLVSCAGRHRFLIHGSGEVELKVAGQTVIRRQRVRADWLKSEPLTLTADYHSIELSFRRTEKDARLMVLWTGPDFGLEPIPPHALFHPREKSPRRDFERGQMLAHVLRCGHCHASGLSPPLAPALDRLNGNLSRAWLVDWLTAGEHEASGADAHSPRRMPSFGLSGSEAQLIADALQPPTKGDHRPVRPKEDKKPLKRVKPSARTGERLFLSLGCLACHRWRDLGAGGWLGGGDLMHVADKRPPEFFSAWLADPAQLNRDHRMPVFPLSEDELGSLALFLAGQKSHDTRPEADPPASAERDAQGRKLITQLHCAACHRMPDSLTAKPVSALPRLSGESDWDRSCLGAPDRVRHRPGYRLAAADARAVRHYYSTARTAPRTGPLLLAEHNCLACHARDGTREALPLLPPLLADKLTAVGKRHPDLAPLLPALTPPALNSVGDKLTDEALRAAIARRGEPHRPYLHVHMPRFPLTEPQLQALVEELIATDRIPTGGTPPSPRPDPARLDHYTLAGGRLVSSDGFGCTSCHQVGHVLPPGDIVSSRGSDLSRLEERIRRPWFDRWVRNPARIVPRMEMPSVQIPVSGVLAGKLDDQLAAVWHVLNLPGFEPSLPNPVRTLRHSGDSPDAAALTVTDIVRHGDKTWIKPFLVGLSNRHNVLFDLESASLARWTAGDVARQRTKGKTWFWELAGTTVLDTGMTTPDLSLLLDGRVLSAQPLGQFITEADAWQSEGSGLVLHYRLAFAAPSEDKDTRNVIVHVRRKLTLLPGGGFNQELVVEHVPRGAKVRLELLSTASARKATHSPDGRTLQLGDRFDSRIILREPAELRFSEDAAAVVLPPEGAGTVRAVVQYASAIPIDRFPELPPTAGAPRKAELVEVAPGFRGERLPLPPDIMPTGLAWRPDGRLVLSSLKGQVFEALDSDGDGVEDRLRLLADGLPAPYGVHAGTDHVDVSAKSAVLRLWDAGKSGRQVEMIASGWGYSQDYHDWAVGLPQNKRGEYFLGIPCQEDKRSPSAARLHGCVLRLVPRRPTADDPRRFALAPLSAGHRFPMGLALDRGGELFVTDNQGNYKPFNELNHVRPGAHFGFINFLDRGRPAPPRTPSAIDIPHPWTRSVNGICFLQSPKGFGPLEGHLIGCEYDTRRLIRMTLQRVGDTFQGAAYPLSIPPQDPERGFLGPLVCAVSPRGDLVVGGIRDSGWGAGNNVGEVVRVRVEPDRLPCGIAEVRATHDGFTIDFFRPVDRVRAAQMDSYAVQSYRREATPAYGGPDRDRRTEKVVEVKVAEDTRRMTLKLAEMRTDFVYELRLKNLARGGGSFHPAEAHYTLLVLPE